MKYSVKEIKKFTWTLHSKIMTQKPRYRLLIWLWVTNQSYGFRPNTVIRKTADMDIDMTRRDEYKKWYDPKDESVAKVQIIDRVKDTLEDIYVSPDIVKTLW